jgi:lysophospholipase L1-like esterase
MTHSSALISIGRRRRLAAAFTLASLGVAGCGGPSEPTPPPIPQLTVTCPAPVEAQSSDGSPVSVTFSSPTTGGGQAPVTLSCSPLSGSVFNGGTTPITCSATDSRGVRATCSTSVFVRLPPRLVATRFMAFGDSITAGRYSDPVRGLNITISQFAYPELLEPLLEARDVQQRSAISMVNEGVPGDLAHVQGIARFRGAMLQHRPEVVLLMMGTNDLLVPLGIDRGIEGLRQIIAQAKSAEFNARVVLATVPPQRSGSRRPFGVPEQVPILNDRIRALATAEGLPLADVYNEMRGDLSLIGEDDLHPTPAGFGVIARVFYDTIVARLEVPQPAVGSLR